MQSRRLLIVDGDSLRTPGMLNAFSDAGWQLDWVSLLQLQLDFLPEGRPDAVLLAPAALAAGDVAVTDLQSRFTGIPLIGGKDRRGDAMPMGLQGQLDLDLAAEQWPGVFASFLAPPAAAPAPAAAKWSTEDLFGDIVAEIEGRVPEAAAPVFEAPVAKVPTGSAEVPAPRNLVPVPPAVPKPMPPVPRPAGLPKPGVPKVPAPAPKPLPARPAAPKPDPVAKAPEPKPTPTPTPEPPPVASREPLTSLGDELRALLGEVEPVAPPKPLPEEFTLSGFSGIHDPFAALAAPEPPAATPEPIPVPVPAPEPTPAPEPVSAEAPALKRANPPAPDARNPLLDSLQMPILEEFGNYYLMEKIAVGGMAELFKARQRGVHDFQKIVAIKRILPHLSDNDEFVRMFIDEAKLAAQLTHPNIAQIFDLGRVSGFYYIAMEFVDGRDLRSMLRKVREYGLPFPEAIAAFVVMKVAGALDYAHRKRGMDDRELKLVHRDVSPQNILISSDGAVKLVDFGIAKAATKSTQTVAGALKGKLLYMSPEQALGQPLDHRSDLFSLGLVLFELLTGERCFQADSELGVLEKVRLGKVTDVRSLNPRISDGMVAILEKTLAKDLDRRYGSARLMERDLRALLSRLGNEPVEHDVADFTGTLLKGTKEQLELHVATRFPVLPASIPAPVPAQPVAPALEQTPTTAPGPRAPESALLEPPPYESEVARAARPGWVLPVVTLVILGLLAVLWLVLGR